MDTASYTRREKDLNCAACALASEMKACPACAFYDAERSDPRIPTIIDIRTVSDVGSRKWRVADVMDFGATLPYSVILYEITDRTLPTALPLSPFGMTAQNDWDSTPCEAMPVIDMDKIDEVPF